MKRFLPVVGLILVSACESNEQTPPAAAASAPAASAPASSSSSSTSSKAEAPHGNGPLVFHAQPGWVEETPSSKMRRAQYKLPKFGADTEDASLVVSCFGPGQGGTKDANLERWASQMVQPDGSSSKERMRLSSRTVNGIALTEADLSGTYVAETSPGSGVKQNKAGWRILNGILEAKDATYFVKLSGPEGTVAHWQSSWTSFLSEVKPGP